MVTSITFLEEYNMLISASKDTLLKVWSIDGQYCIDTYIGHRTEIWSMVLFTQSGYKDKPDEEGLTKYNLLTGSSDQSLRLFSIYKDPRVFSTEADEDGKEVGGSEHVLEYRGCVTVSQSGRTGQLLMDSTQSLVGYFNVNKVFMLYRVRSFAGSIKRMKRRIRRRKERGGGAKARGKCSDAMELVSTVKTTHKLTSFDFGRQLKESDEVEVLFGMNNNSMQLYRLSRNNSQATKDEEGRSMENTGSYEKVLSIALAGHRSDVRALALTSTDDLILSVGQKDAKVWSVRSLECVRSIDVVNGLCCCILPGDKHAVIGTKDGKLVLVDLNTGDVMQTVQAHKGSIWSVDVRQDSKGMMSGGADHNICFWEISFWLSILLSHGILHFSLI